MDGECTNAVAFAEAPRSKGVPRDGVCCDFNRTASAMSLARCRFSGGPPTSSILEAYSLRFVAFTLHPVRSLMKALSGARMEP